MALFVFEAAAAIDCRRVVPAVLRGLRYDTGQPVRSRVGNARRQEPGVDRPARRARMIVVLMLTTVPDAATAEALSGGALDARLAACVSELGAIRSRYHWQGKVETADEIQLLFKTSPVRALELERFILAHHPYETPEIVSWQATASAAYGQWVTSETQRLFHV
ncbi:uncharacterized protein involved in tolerance to divalent cations [Burkholderia sp. 572]